MTTLRIPRTSQPQTPVGIDWGNPITRGLQVVWDGANPSNVFIKGTRSAVNRSGYISVRSGRVCSSGNVFTSASSEFIDLGPFPSFTALTTFLLAESSAVNSFAASCRSSSTTQGFDTVLFGSGGTAGANIPLRIGVGSGSAYPGSTTSANDGILHSYVGAWNQGNVRGWFDGASTGASGSDFASGTITPTQNLYIARRSATYFSGFVGLFLVWTRELSDAEIKSLSDNPWQIFQPVQRAIYVGEGAVVLETIGRPVSDTSAGAWVPSSGGNLYAMIDEVAADEGDYISVSSLSTCEVQLNNTAFPGGANQVLRYRAKSATGNGVTVTMKQGATTIASWSHGLTGTITTYTQTLTAPQIAAIVAGPISVTLTST